MSTHKTYGPYLLLLLLLLTHSGLAQRGYRYEVGFRNDNDVYLLNQQDQYYTNGLMLYFRKAVDTSLLSDKLAGSTWGVTAGQKMFNSFTAQIHRVEDVDRPITGYLFVNASLNRFYRNEAAFHVSAEAGMIGQKALGRPIQETIHRIFRLYDIAGWEFQLEEAVGVDVSTGYIHLLHRNKSGWFDISAQGSATLGLNYTGFSAAPVFRLGKLGKLYESAYTSSRIGSATNRKELFFFYAPHIRYTAYDATIQGGFFLQDKGPVTTKPLPWMLSQRVGMMYSQNAITLNLEYYYNTKEAQRVFFRHQYGSLSVAYRF